MKNLCGMIVAAALTFSGLAAHAQKDPDVGGAAMYPSKNIVENAVNSKDHTTLVAAVKAAGLVETLEGPGPFTVFAPTNEAFDKLPAGTVDTLLKPENKAQLVKIFDLPCRGRPADHEGSEAPDQNGRWQSDVEDCVGGTLTATLEGGKIVLTDEKGGMATITIADVIQSNGVIQVIDNVLLQN